MTSQRKKNVDKSNDFESFMQQTSDYLPPAIVENEDDKQQSSKQSSQQDNKQDSKDNIKHNNKQDSRQDNSLSALFSETKPKEKVINTTLQLPQSVNKRFKKLCQKLGKSKNEVLLIVIEALLEEKGL